MFDEEIPVETVKEIYLTDDLADSLVNPPADHAVSDEEGSMEMNIDDLPEQLNEENNEKINSSSHNKEMVIENKITKTS